VRCDVTSEQAVADAFRSAVLTYGGVDIVVNNAGVVTTNLIENTTLAEWQKNMDVLATGYFLVSREAFRVFKRQQKGGSLIFVGSKNSLSPSKGVSAYNAAKAAELHLARTLAEEGGAFGIRVNSVLPDAVLQGSGMWSSDWREARAQDYGIKPEDMDEFYRKRSTLKVNVYPEDIAEAILFLAGPRSAKTTGGVLTVDGGVPTAYVR
jgi:NAD(P)-dependent dehydrogenase (short-subunit alcohol dehydrogenase family)